jgi:hypothetical protein
MNKERQYLNEAHRKNSEACQKEVAYWLEHPLTYEEAMHMFKHQGDELKALREKQKQDAE